MRLKSENSEHVPDSFRLFQFQFRKQNALLPKENLFHQAFLEFFFTFLVANKRLYIRACPTIGRSVSPSVTRFFYFGIQSKKWSNFHQCPSPRSRLLDGCRPCFRCPMVHLSGLDDPLPDSLDSLLKKMIKRIKRTKKFYHPSKSRIYIEMEEIPWEPIFSDFMWYSCQESWSSLFYEFSLFSELFKDTKQGRYDSLCLSVRPQVRKSIPPSVTLS